MNGKKLSSGKTFEELDLKDGATLNLVFRVSGGVSFTFNRMENKVIRQFKRSPGYRIVDKGLNLEAMCTNKKCDACDKKTWVRKGFGKFNLGK